jgi:membrane-bound lytic murein transglycosylase D
LGKEIEEILREFGRPNYLVPDLFIDQVNEKVYSFSKTSAREIMLRSFANSPKYRPIIEEELKRANMPLAFFYLAMHESLLDPTIESVTGARGLWQFTQAAAKDYGLRVPPNWRSLPTTADERCDQVLSTRAGVKYLKNLMAEFGDVALAMAAYNAGPGRIRSALRQVDDPVNNRDFWYLYRMGILTEETNEYFPKIIATMIVDRNRERYGFPKE